MRGRESGGWVPGRIQEKGDQGKSGLAGREGALTWVSAPAYVIPYAPQPVSLEVGQLDRGVHNASAVCRGMNGQIPAIYL
jgi:hypothetical protein